MNTEILANGIPPDVGGDIFYRIGRTDDVVIVARLPETANLRFLEALLGFPIGWTDLEHSETP